MYILDQEGMQIMTLHHDSPITGHLGYQKTQELIEWHYYWPGLSTEQSLVTYILSTSHSGVIFLLSKPNIPSPYYLTMKGKLIGVVTDWFVPIYRFHHFEPMVFLGTVPHHSLLPKGGSLCSLPSTTQLWSTCEIQAINVCIYLYFLIVQMPCTL